MTNVLVILKVLEDRKREEEKQFVASTLERFEARLLATDQAMKQVSYLLTSHPHHPHII